MERRAPLITVPVTRWDFWLAGVMFCVTFAFGAFAIFGGGIVSWLEAHHALALLGVVVLAVLAAANQRLRHRFVQALANRIGVGDPMPVARAWVIDGDTIDDSASGVRYRLANIDAPETGDNARCFNERRRGEQARAAAIRLVRNAAQVTVRRTWRIDRYGRRVAFVQIDGQDLGELLMAQGLASKWRGRRMPWCGRKGPLAKMAALRNEQFYCSACAPKAWR